MAEPERDRAKRPSRLLNLNKARKAQKKIAARNAAESPLLRLTPELRVRIYDYVFGSTPIHIRSTEDWEYDKYPKHYELMRCEHPQEHVEIPPRYIERVNPSILDQKRIPGCTIRPRDYGKTLSGADINLGLLLVCRQIYQEAVLKPFSEIPFYFIVCWTDKGWPGLEALAEDLAPPQLKAFKRLRIVLEHVYFGLPSDPCRSVGFGRLPDKKAMRKFTGRKNLEIVLNPQFWANEEAHFCCQHLDEHFVHGRDNYYCRSMSWLQALPDLRLNSIRLVIEAQICEMGRSEVRRPFPTISSKGQTETIKKWLRQTELDLHFGEDVVRVDEPVLFGVKQNDDAIRIPPWNTDEVIERDRVERERLAELDRLENQAFQAVQEERMRAGHPPVWSLAELTEMAEIAQQEVPARDTVLQAT